MKNDRPIIVAISGLSSNTGKTTLACELLRRLPGWEAIKLTRGHYRSCGKDPNGCCVSDLLREEPLIRSGREANYEFGKDTGRFWDAGATNVHWVIVGEDQVEQGINRALTQVQAEGVIVEGNLLEPQELRTDPSRTGSGDQEAKGKQLDEAHKSTVVLHSELSHSCRRCGDMND